MKFGIEKSVLKVNNIQINNTNRGEIWKKYLLLNYVFVGSTTNTFAEVKMGIILGFTGPIESLTPAMAASAELAFKEASDSGSLLGGEKIKPIRADSTCVDSAAATTAAEGLVSQGVAAIASDCSGVTELASNVAVSNGIVISPSQPRLD